MLNTLSVRCIDLEMLLYTLYNEKMVSSFFLIRGSAKDDFFKFTSSSGPNLKLTSFNAFQLLSFDIWFLGIITPGEGKSVF